MGGIFPKDKYGCRPVNVGEKKLLEDPHRRDFIQFCEYFHGVNGAGLGANHQTLWTGDLARAMDLFVTTTAGWVLELAKVAAITGIDKPKKGAS